MGNPIHDIPDRLPPKPEEETDSEKKSYYSKDDLLNIAAILGLAVVGIFILYLAYVGISALGDLAEDVFKHIKRLFRDAPYMFRSSRGFGAFVELILIAGFIGWVIHRFKK